MKFLATLLVMLSSVSGFAPNAVQTRHSFVLKAHADSSKAIDEAMRLSKEFGSASPEARVAWDIVEEIDASFNMKNAFATEDYKSHVTKLSTLMKASESMLKEIKQVAEELRKIEVESPNAVKGAGEISDLFSAKLALARACDDMHGPNSVEAKKAWEIVDLVACGLYEGMDEPISKDSDRYKASAVASHHHQLDLVVDPADLDHAINAIAQLAHLSKQMDIEQKRLVIKGQMMP